VHSNDFFSHRLVQCVCIRQEIQREIYSSQQQLHIYEERLRSATSHQRFFRTVFAVLKWHFHSETFFFCCRLFEPDPAAFGSTSEIDGCEKVLADLLARVVQRKVSESRSEPAAI